MENMDPIIESVARYGLTPALIIYIILRMDQRLGKIEDAMSRMARAVTKLCAKVGFEEDE